MKIRFSTLICFLIILTTLNIQAQNQEDYRVVSAAVPFLSISPDSKAAAMGDAGVASTPDANSVYWNVAKLAFVENKTGVSVSYAPWLKDLVGDMGLMTINGYKKVGTNRAITGGITYFDQGKILFTTNTGTDAGQFHSREFSIHGGVTQKLTQDLSMGVVLKMINSNLTGTGSGNPTGGKPGRTAAGDIGLYYNRNRPTKELQKTDFAFGLAIQNLGGKINYGFSQYFIPANLKVGTSITITPDIHNKFNFLVDFNKLLVPTPTVDGSLPNVSSIEGLFKSFGDAPDGFKEEIREVMGSIGAEYNYDNLLAIRGGYFFESKSKGGRKFATMGLGLKIKEYYGIDMAYLIPTNSGNPLANTWRLSVNIILNRNNASTEGIVE